MVIGTLVVEVEKDYAHYDRKEHREKCDEDCPDHHFDRLQSVDPFVHFALSQQEQGRHQNICPTNGVIGQACNIEYDGCGSVSDYAI